MQPHQQRVIDGKADLDVKITKLRDFIEAIQGALRKETE